MTLGCISFTGAAKDRCTVDSIIAFKSDDKGLLNEQVQSLLRNVPYGTFNQTRWSFDKFILFWAPYVNPFNLFPYSHLVHNPVDGVNAPGAYSFSIDDKFGNFGGRGSGILVEVGGNKHLLNQDPYDLWEQFRVSFGPGWDHATVCGRPYTIPMNLGNAAAVSFWINGQPQTPCNIAMYKDAAETQFAKFQLTEASNTVTDTYTGQTQTVTQLAYDPSSCNSNLNAVCAGSHLVFTAVPQPVPGNDDPDPGKSWVKFVGRRQTTSDTGRTRSAVGGMAPPPISRRIVRPHSVAAIPRQIKAPSPNRDPDPLAAQKINADDPVAKVPIRAERVRLLCQHIGIRASRYRGTDLEAIKPMDV